MRATEWEITGMREFTVYGPMQNTSSEELIEKHIRAGIGCCFEDETAEAANAVGLKALENETNITPTFDVYRVTVQVEKL